MKKILCWFAVVIFFTLAGTAQVWGMELVRGVITSAVLDREPVDELQTVPAQTNKVYCFTQVKCGEMFTEGLFLTHVWTFQGKEMARVVLPIHASHWRTWSSKRLMPHWRGHWQVDILDDQGKLLGSVPFDVE